MTDEQNSDIAGMGLTAVRAELADMADLDASEVLIGDYFNPTEQGQRRARKRELESREKELRGKLAAFDDPAGAWTQERVREWAEGFATQLEQHNQRQREIEDVRALQAKGSSVRSPEPVPIPDTLPDSIKTPAQFQDFMAQCSALLTAGGQLNQRAQEALHAILRGGELANRRDAELAARGLSRRQELFEHAILEPSDYFEADLSEELGYLTPGHANALPGVAGLEGKGPAAFLGWLTFICERSQFVERVAAAWSDVVSIALDRGWLVRNPRKAGGLLTAHTRQPFHPPAPISEAVANLRSKAGA